MIDKIVRAIITAVGATLGAFLGVILNQNGLLKFSGLQNILIIIGISLIFGIIFFLLSAKIKKTGQRIAEAFEKELLKFSTIDIIWGALGLIVGFVIAFYIPGPGF